MRGKHLTLGNQLRPIRNIPAYAGKTKGSEIQNTDYAEHPRVCGENLLPVWVVP